MAQPVLLKTARGTYRLSVVEHAGAGASLVTFSVEHAGGLEKFAFRCKLADESDPDAAAERVAPWLERQFEQVREAALKSIRAERRLAEIEFDRSGQGSL